MDRGKATRPVHKSEVGIYIYSLNEFLEEEEEEEREFVDRLFPLNEGLKALYKINKYEGEIIGITE